MRVFTALLIASLAGAAASAQTGSVMLKGTGGRDAGTTMLTATPKGVFLRLQATGLTPGWHAIHFHEKGDCSAADFTSAGGHTHMATPVVHGLLNPGENDTGDLPNIWAGSDGKVNAELFTTYVTLASLMDADGSAIVIHANPDDHQTQPIGGAGARVACGIIK